jgi:hypothetical protein
MKGREVRNAVAEVADLGGVSTHNFITYWTFSDLSKFKHI